MKRYGFTLIELMIVVAIIAIIAAIAIPNMIRARASANEASAIASLRTIASAEVQFKVSGARIINQVPQFGNLNSLGVTDPPILDPILGQSNNPVKSGYQFSFALGSSTIAPSSSRRA